VCAVQCVLRYDVWGGGASATSQDCVRRVTSLNQWRRGGEPAPHKPLLLLYVLGRLQRTGTSLTSFAEAEGNLRRLLQEFGPPRETSPGYPFHHLTSDGLWEVRTPSGLGSPGPNLGALRAGARGELSSEFVRDLDRDAQLFATVVRAILDANYPPMLYEDILSATGISIEPAELVEAAGATQRRRRRDPAFRDQVLLAYEYRCAMCGSDGQLQREAVGIDAAHVRWWAAEGPDEVGNGIAACSFHHKLLDRGAIGLTAQRWVAVSTHFIGRGPMAETLVLSLVDQPILTPQPGQPPPHRDHIAWHTAEVFRATARQGRRDE
jgi:putative restriction endonuclease